MANSKTGTGKTTAAGHIKSRSFVEGYTEARAGANLDPERYRDNLRDQVQYERGRQFAALYDGPLKEGVTVLMSAQIAYIRACNSAAII